MPTSSVHPSRFRTLNQTPYQGGSLVYWMSRDQRVHDNWALQLAAERAAAQQVPLAVVFCLSPKFLGATMRHYDFMLRGLREVATELERREIGFYVLLGEATKVLPEFVHHHKVGGIVTDFSPLRIGREWREKVAKKISIPVVEVDAHNIVPVWHASPKLEIGARTLRPKIQRLLPEFLIDFPKLPTTPAWPEKPIFDLDELLASVKVDEKVAPVTWIEPGEEAAQHALTHFIRKKLINYNTDRNDPTKHAQSDLSPYLHYGQLSAQRVALEVQNAVTAGDITSADSVAFLEELIVRRELADNFCFYQPQYDSVDCFPQWAKKSLVQHARDTRPHLYTLHQLEQAQTGDELWNASQLELLKRGKIHGYMRMYWAKKILEWTPDPATAMEYAVYLNDRYELDGRDPNGYTGIAWSMGGVHDRPWFDRPIFGVVRYMNENGARNKFDVDGYIQYAQAL